MHDIAARRQGEPRKHEIDVNGLLITPGRVDVHPLRRSGDLGPSPCPSSWHGVTTILFWKVRRREVRPATELRGDVIT